ncbi:hypothetical protein V2I29_08305, partial [Campylobacter sp. CX2-8023-23]|nr:hypothetical protein [Campylobacter sp. CX2-8023-23]
YAEFYHDGKNAIQKLLTERQGQVAGAFERKELGDIDLPWGEITDAIKHKGYGLAHILDKRTAEFIEQGLSKKQAEAKAIELINKLPDIIKNGEIEQKGGRFRIQKDDYVIGLTSEYKGEKRNWIITAFEKDKKGNPQSFTEADFTAKSDNLLSNPTKNSTTTANKSQWGIKSTSKMPEISAGSKIKNEIFKNFMADEGVVQAAIVNDFENFKLFAKNKLDDLLVDAYNKNPDETRKLFDNVIGEFEPALNEFHKIAQSGELGAAKKTITQKQDLGKWELDKKALWHFENTINTSAGGIKKEYADDLAKIDELNLGDEVKFKLKEKYEKFLSRASDRVTKSKGGKVTFHHKKWGDATELEAFRTKLFNENSTPNELLSQGQVPTGWMRGSTNIGNSWEEQPKWADKFKAKMTKMGQEYSNEKIANLANWHKDSHPATKESDGSPKVFYHGTNANFDAFDTNKLKGSWLGKSFYFTDTKQKAKGYGKNVMSIYLNIKNPYISKANDNYGFVKEVKEQFNVKENFGEFDPAQVLKKHGYDGVVYKDWNDDIGYIYTAFSPNQIKSISNNGAFNPRSKMMDAYTKVGLPIALVGGGLGYIGAQSIVDGYKNKDTTNQTRAKQYAKFLAEANEPTQDAPNELYKAYTKAKKDIEKPTKKINKDKEKKNG